MYVKKYCSKFGFIIASCKNWLCFYLPAVRVGIGFGGQPSHAPRMGVFNLKLNEHLRYIISTNFMRYKRTQFLAIHIHAK
jgi:hypothetical protein